MRNILNPKWLFIINTLPVAVLFFLLFGQYNIIKTLLDENAIRLWKLFGLTLSISALLNVAYSAYLTIRKRTVSVFYGIFALLFYISFIYLYALHLEEIIPFSIPQWMIAGNKFLYVGTFMMPTLVYSLFVLVARFTPEVKEHKAWINFLIAIAIPLAGFLLSILPWDLFDAQDHLFDDKYLIHIGMIIVIAATLVFLFFLMRGIVILTIKKSAVWQKYQLAWKIPIAVVLPLLGLWANTGFFLDEKFSLRYGGIFGDFTNIWFFILAVLNGVLICLPNFENKFYRLFLFTGRSITFAFTCYFFLVFLPFLPLSVIAIISFGLGFLMLTPLLLFIIHTNEMTKDFKYLKTAFLKWLIIGITVLGFLVIPTCVSVTYLKDKTVLTQTLDYLYNSDYSKQYNIDKNSLQKTLNVVKHHKDRDDFLGTYQIPYLSSYFNWLVLDNLTLSDEKINYIEKVFFNETTLRIWADEIRNDSVEITNISTSSTYDKSQNAWKSWVDLEITNKNRNNRFAEYATTIDLPEGCWISDYYLYVDSTKKAGILAEKKSAMWIFSQIRNTGRDPGILHYLTGNKVAFRVFPFAEAEVRKTGIEFLHKEPVTLRIDDKTVALGNKEETVYENIGNENVIYISSQQKQSLKKVKRKPYVHFLVDVSKNKEKYVDDFTKRIEKFLENNTEYLENVKISYVNSYVKSSPLNNDWKQTYQSQTFEGGFYLDRAIRTAFFDAYKNKQYPVIVVVTDSIQNAILNKNFSDFKFAFPESNYFFNLGNNERLYTHSLIGNPSQNISQVIIVPTYEEFMENITSAMLHHTFDQSVLEYKLSDGTVAYLPDNDQPSIILKKDIFDINPQEIKEKNWQSALIIQAKQMSQILHPETADKAWQNMVKYSFLSKIMTPATSYLVVENEAQKAMLKAKQEESLSGKQYLDLGEDTQSMSEPSWWILAVLFYIVLLCKKIHVFRSGNHTV
jgi:hypothetical protein